MKTFKTLAATLCLATAAFASVPAQAGMKLNGITYNGIIINGIVLNGIIINGIVLNGIIINGAEATGIEAGTPVAVTLPEAASE